MNNQIINIVKNAYSHLNLTNCMIPISQIEQGLIDKRYDIVSEHPLVLVESHTGFNQLYYFLESGDIDSISGINNDLLLSYSPLYADITLKTDFQYEGSVFSDLGFKPFRKYIRKSVVNSNLKIRRMMDTQFATLDNLNEIKNLLDSQFDLMADHIPTDIELAALIQRQQVLIIPINGVIAGTLLFEDIGKRSYASALCVSPDYQNSFVGYSLLADYFIRHDMDKTRLFYLWVDEANVSVKKLHDRFGYRFDGLNNYIFRR